MIEIKDLRKSYTTGGFVSNALDGVTLAFRDNEFVAVLGPSGSGKTTLLNVLGGLDHADSGDIVINGISTKNYKSGDWDTYRNHRIGFIFQSYNLIPHQSVLSNVELALTLSNVGRAERLRRARAMLQRVGLGEHMGKRPSQLSGGQMQRVAIARALINDPDIVLADEPTGALDTETGLQVMDLLSEVAKDRLVIMVTHNPDLAERYATRIVNFHDGKVVGDSRPVAAAGESGGAGTVPASGRGSQAAPSGPSWPRHSPDSPAPTLGGPAGFGNSMGEKAASGRHARAGRGGRNGGSPDGGKGKKASMGFLTALSLSFNNLMTKKGRTFLTAFAGSIGIIGIAAILALSNGVNSYIADTEEEALTAYPLTITKSSFDLASLMTGMSGYASGGEAPVADGVPRAARLIPQSTIMTDMFAQVKNNDLVAFKRFLDEGGDGIRAYVNDIEYNYGIEPLIYKPDTSNGLVKLNPSYMKNVFSNGLNTSSLMSMGGGMSSFQEMLSNRSMLEAQMEVLEGRWPESYDEAVLVLSRSGKVSDYTLYSLGVQDPKVMEDMTKRALNGEEVEVPDEHVDFSYEDAMALSFKVVPAALTYQRNAEQGTWTDMSGDVEFMKQRVAEGIDLKVVGVVKAREDASTALLTEGVAYTPELTRRLMEAAADSEIVRQQQADRDVDVFTGRTFEELQDEEGGDFDLGSIFSVDEEALGNAFGFDAGALSGLGDMNLDLSGLALDADSTSIDPEALQVDPEALSGVFSEDAMRQVMAGAPRFTMAGSGMADAMTNLTPEQQQAISEASNRLAAGFMAWLATSNPSALVPGSGADMSALFQEYLASDAEAQAIVAEMGRAATEEFESQVNDAMQNYMTNQFAPYMTQAMQALMTQAAQVMAASMAEALATQMAAATDSFGTTLAQAISGQLGSQMSQLAGALRNGFSFDADAFANAIQFNMTQEDLTSLLTNYMNAADLTYDGNLEKLGYASLDDPETISIYAKNFSAKEEVLGIIDGYNDRAAADGDDSEAIQYSDIAGVLMSSVTNIVNMISLVLIAFVSISLVVSSIMIGIVTYISVLERKKEIGILRSLGASRGNIANVFNAETVIEGLIAGVFAIAVVLLVSIPVNALIWVTQQVPDVMQLPWSAAAILVGISVLLTFIAGLIPSQKAAHADPVEALRSE